MADSYPEKRHSLKKLEDISVRYPELKTIISDLERDLKDLIAREQRLEMLSNRSQIAYHSLDTEGTILEVNDVWLQLTGYDKREVVGKNLTHFLNTRSAVEFQKCLETFQAKGEVHGLLLEIVKKDGGEIYLESNGGLEINGDGSFGNPHCFLKDVSSFKNTELRLNEARQDLETIFNAIGHPTMVLDVDHRILKVNKALIDLSGKTESELTGKKCYEIFHNQQAPPAGCPFSKVLVSGDLESFDMEIEAFGGWFLVSCTPVLDEAGNIKEIIHIATDITKRKIAENRLRDSEERYRSLSESMPDLILRFDRKFRYLYSNNAISRYLDIVPEDIIGRTIREIGFPVEICEYWENNLESVFKTGISVEDEFELEGKNGASLFNWRLFPEFDENGEVKSALSISRDITLQSRSQKNYNLLLRNMLDGFALHEMIFDDQGNPVDYRFISINPAFEKLTGLKSSELIGKTVLEVLPQTEASWIEKYGRVVKTGKSIRFEDFSAELNKYFEVETFRPVPGQFACIFQDKTQQMIVLKALQDSETRYRKVVENANEGIFVIQDERVKFHNHKTLEITGFQEQDLEAKSFIEVIHTDDKAMALERYSRRLKGDILKDSYSYRMITKEGDLKWIEIKPVLITWDDKPATLNFMSDITERILRESELRRQKEVLESQHVDLIDAKMELERSKSTLSTILKAAPVGIGVIINRVFKMTNEVIHKMTGYTQEELDGQNAMIVYPNREEFDFVGKEKYRQIDEFGTGTIETKWKHKDGSIIDVLLSSAPINQQDLNEGVIFTVLDITQRKRLQNLTMIQKELATKLSETSNLTEALSYCLDAAFSVSGTDSGGIYLLDEKNNELILKYSKGLKDEFIAAASFFNADSANTRLVLQGKPIYTLFDHSHLHRKDIYTREGLTSVSAVPIIHEAKVIGCMNVASHKLKFISESAGEALVSIGNQVGGIISRIKAEDALRESEERYRHLFDEDLAGDYISTPEGTLITCNAAFAGIFGFDSVEAALQTPIGKLYIEPDDRIKFLEVLKREKRLKSYERDLITFDGRKIHIIENTVGTFDESGKLTQIKGYIIDNTERKLLEAQLIQSQKMEGIGRLAGGIAHDFNNLLTAITGNTDLALMSLNERDPLTEELTEIRNAANRAADLTRQLLAFSRRQTLQPKILILNDIISNLEKMLTRLIGEDIELRLSLAKDLWQVKADPGQIEQVIINLVVNARDAMINGGRLTIASQNIFFDEEYTRKSVVISSGKYSVFEISDTGSGMDEDVIAQIFDPFFTTKEEGKGTGLGLSTVYGIISQSGGYIQVFSEVGKGSTFRVFLPVVAEAADTILPGAVAAAIPRGNETLMVVEDEDGVRNLAVKLLKRQGYKVLEAQSGGDAYLLCRKLEKPVDLIISDVIMPNMNGVELYSRIKEIWPDTRILYMSGYTDEAILHHGVLEPGIPYIQKPFLPADFAAKVREVLDLQKPC